MGKSSSYIAVKFRLSEALDYLNDIRFLAKDTISNDVSNDLDRICKDIASVVNKMAKEINDDKTY